MHRLEAVTDVGQCAPDDDAHRVVEIRPLHLQLEVDLIDAAVVVHRLGALFVCHVYLYFVAVLTSIAQMSRNRTSLAFR